MKILFDNLSVEISRMTTRTYSTSFSMGIYFIDARLRDAIYSIYGYVRLADEIVDSFDGFEQRHLLEKLTAETYEAIESKISINPILNSFQNAVNKYEIDLELIRLFLRSMEMDLEKVLYDTNNYNQYILGSAEVVGLMCLHVFTENDKAKFEELKPSAMKLGAAFQKVNFLRDMKDDYQILGRSYFPGVDIQEFNHVSKEQIELEIEEDFNAALIGIRKLPISSKRGVYLAYIYYKTLFNKIKSLPAHKVLTERVRINNGRKLGLMINCLVQNKMKWV
ncbi:phytoene/squalene synthase family protein [Daejeonella lutea]|uniref:Phytoene/squalene synthetase n=1 Tax=Daejeonella lutea TaxID=572036 RepID=A0A1T5AGK4_9SPHI|nr:phytoene/squalene synthase family protein [Daejeonella lutea]SKB34066.1 Phytoene/squalene synthetase [Daejeonella lutea]